MADKKTNKPEDQNQVADPSRRRFVKNTGMAFGGLAGGGLRGGLLTNQTQQKSNENSSKLIENKAEKKDDKKDVVAADKPGAKNDDAAKKMYCN